MTDDRHMSSAQDLERMLTDLRPHVAFPPTPDLAGSIRAQIASQRIPRNGAWTVLVQSLLQPRRLAVGFLILLLAVAGVLVTFPDLRTAVADRLGLGAIRIEFVDETPEPSASPVDVTMVLGEAMTLDEAQARVMYLIRVPAELGAPDEVYLRQIGSGPMVSLLYRPRPDLPEAAETGVGAILMQFPADSSPDALVKRITMGMGSAWQVQVADAEGFWIAGVSSFVVVDDPSEDFEEMVGRPSANILLWQVGNLTYRLETDLVLPDALRIAESLEPIPDATPGTDPVP